MKIKKSILFGMFVMLSLFSAPFAFAGEDEGIGASEGINLSPECLTGMGKGCFSYDNLMFGSNSEIAQTNKNRTVTTIAQDVILAATYFVGTILTFIIIYCGLMYIFASRGGNSNVSQYKKGLINAAIGAVLVWGAYAIVRLIQYIAKG